MVLMWLPWLPEFIHLTSQYNKHPIPLLNFPMENTMIEVSDKVWNLGVLFQNTAARLITGTSKVNYRDQQVRSTMLKDLHWLPIATWINFKILLILKYYYWYISHCLTMQAPKYLSRLISECSSNVCVLIRSSHHCCVPTNNYKYRYLWRTSLLLCFYKTLECPSTRLLHQVL